MGRKRDEANANIEWLVSLLIEEKKKALGKDKCPYGNVCQREDMGNCDRCREEYFTNLQNQYLVASIVR